MSANQLEEKLRSAPVPVITRIIDSRVMIDLRTVAEDEESDLVAAVNDAVQG
jgi:L-seryl-tRNA(Ser) seleniumtransferase